MNAIAQSRSSIQFIPYEKAYGVGFEDMLYRLPDISKAERVIGYRPTKTLTEILQSVVEFYRTKTSGKMIGVGA